MKNLLIKGINRLEIKQKTNKFTLWNCLATSMCFLNVVYYDYFLCLRLDNDCNSVCRYCNIAVRVKWNALGNFLHLWHEVRLKNSLKSNLCWLFTEQKIKGLKVLLFSVTCCLHVTNVLSRALFLRYALALLHLSQTETVRWG